MANAKPVNPDPNAPKTEEAAKQGGATNENEPKPPKMHEVVNGMKRKDN